MESQHRSHLPFARNLGELHSRRISSCSSGSATSSSYASSDDNMFVSRQMDNNNTPKHLDARFQTNSHDNKAYRHEEQSRPFSALSCETELADLERDSNHLRQVSYKLRSCSNCRHSEDFSLNGSLSRTDGLYNSCAHHKRLPVTHRRTEGVSSQASSQGELMHGRPLPLTPENELSANAHRTGSTTPLRYQNDSPFVTAAKSTHDHGSPRLSSRTDSPQPIQTSSEKQRSAEELLKQVPWFRPKMTREQVLESLSREDLGAFIIRESSTHNTCFALSVKVPKFNNPTGIAHYIIHRTPSQGFKLKGLDKEWTNLSSLVIHHTIMPELLPCTLKIPRLPQSRRHSTSSRTSNSSRGSNDSSPSLEAKRAATSSPADRLAQTLEKRLNISSYPEAV